VDNAGNVLTKYTQGPGIDQPLSELRSGTTSYYQQDGLNSVTSLSNSAGTLTNTYSFDSFGKLISSAGTVINPFQYTGREFDSETGQYFYRARYLDQNIGRFLSEDRFASVREQIFTRTFEITRLRGLIRAVSFIKRGTSLPLMAACTMTLREAWKYFAPRAVIYRRVAHTILGAPFIRVRCE